MCKLSYSVDAMPSFYRKNFFAFDVVLSLFNIRNELNGRNMLHFFVIFKIFSDRSILVEIIFSILYV